MTTGRPIGEGFCSLPDLRTLGPSHFPLIVVKLGPAFQLEPVAVRTGAHAARIACGDCRVLCPEPFDDEGKLSATARQLLIESVQSAVCALRIRMCIVWSGSDCSYVEVDRVNDSKSPPSGGVLTPFPVQFEDRETLQSGPFRLIGPGAPDRNRRTLN